jgi:hypothetical protein
LVCGRSQEEADDPPLDDEDEDVEVLAAGFESVLVSVLVDVDSLFVSVLVEDEDAGLPVERESVR